MQYVTLEAGTKLWAAETTAVRFGSSESNAYAFETPFRGVFDSTSSFIRVPSSLAAYVVEKATEDSNTFA